MRKLPALNRLGYLWDGESGTLIRREKGKHPMPRKMQLRIMAEMQRERATREPIFTDEVPF